ncbi:MAG: hypothetical protein A2V81_03020 [Candidatus Abawacabacteria bacterium RBG_16_42_10]|uniref:Uncharacterized protein n=1 Tax=Candidatus Abawacabacteria bacterium RBG_16_42_10 TaxID=1817814 RepID=A0A1F4XKC1_9BACT|nr:MAG: hypothetical protein A2V81_03020 [Candidatus Abawacabacteria bacterium RBG_16_42_10]
MDIAIAQGVVDDICVIPEDQILPKVDYNEKLPQIRKQGNTSLIARFIAETMAEKVSNRLFLSLIYDKEDRYGVPQYV